MFYPQRLGLTQPGVLSQLHLYVQSGRVQRMKDVCLAHEAGVLIKAHSGFHKYSHSHIKISNMLYHGSLQNKH